MKTDRSMDSYVYDKTSVMLRRNTDWKELNHIHAPIRGHSVAECKASIAMIYNISGLHTSTTQKVVQILLEGVRFICRTATRQVTIYTRDVPFAMLTVGKGPQESISCGRNRCNNLWQVLLWAQNVGESRAWVPESNWWCVYLFCALRNSPLPESLEVGWVE